MVSGSLISRRPQGARVAGPSPARRRRRAHAGAGRACTVAAPTTVGLGTATSASSASAPGPSPAARRRSPSPASTAATRTGTGGPPVRTPARWWSTSSCRCWVARASTRAGSPSSGGPWAGTARCCWPGGSAPTGSPPWSPRAPPCGTGPARPPRAPSTTQRTSAPTPSSGGERAGRHPRCASTAAPATRSTRRPPDYVGGPSPARRAASSRAGTTRLPALVWRRAARLPRPRLSPPG